MSALARPLFHESGALLFAAGERLGEDEISLLRRSGIKRIYDVGGPEEAGAAPGEAGAPDERSSAGWLAARAGPAELREPAVTPEDVRAFRYERRSAAALRAIEKAAARVREERVIQDPRGELRNGGVERVLARSRAGERPEGTPWRERLAELRPEPPRAAAEKEAARKAAASIVARLSTLFASLKEGGGVPGDAAFLADLGRDLLALAARDPELAIALALGRRGAAPAVPPAASSPESLARHAFAVAALSVATAIELDYALEQVLEIGEAALIHDVGMVRLPDALAEKPAELDEDERRELERHPLHALEVLRRFPEVPVAAVQVALEEHERPDGSGYPKHAQESGELARIVAVADVFEAISAPRPHRPARRPHDAVRELVALAAKKKLDAKILRGFLKSVSLFPVGSFLRLSDGALARVIRAGGPDAARPTVAVIEPPQGFVELAQRPELKILEADLEPPAAAAADPLVGF